MIFTAAELPARIPCWSVDKSPVRSTPTEHTSQPQIIESCGVGCDHKDSLWTTEVYVCNGPWVSMPSL